MADPRNAAGVLDEALGIAKKVASDADVLITVTTARDANTRFARSEVTSTGEVEETRVAVRVAFGKRHATTTTNQADAASLRSAIENAARLARLSPPDPELEPLLGPQKYGPSAGFDKAADSLDPAARANAVSAAIEAAERGGVEMAGFFEHHSSHVHVGNSAGLRASHDGTWVSCSATARTKDGTGSGWGAASSHRAADVDAAAIARTAVDKAQRSKTPRTVEPGSYTVVLEPAAVAGLMGFMGMALDVRLADEGRSAFAKPGGGGRLGDKVFSDLVTLRSDPGDARAPSAPFDPDGFPLRPYAWADHGTLKKLWASRHWAKERGYEATGRPRNLIVDAGSASMAELISGVKRGLLVTRFWYIRMVDPQQILLTGLTRDGTFLIEDGKVVAPVKNFRFNESPVAMLKNAEALGKDRAVFSGGFGGTRIVVPALRTHEFHMSSASDAV